MNQPQGLRRETVSFCTFQLLISAALFIIHGQRGGALLVLSVCHFVQAIIKEQLQETNGMCEYAVYVQGEASSSHTLTRRRLMKLADA